MGIEGVLIRDRFRVRGERWSGGHRRGGLLGRRRRTMHGRSTRSRFDSYRRQPFTMEMKDRLRWEDQTPQRTTTSTPSTRPVDRLASPTLDRSSNPFRPILSRLQQRTILEGTPKLAPLPSSLIYDDREGSMHRRTRLDRPSFPLYQVRRIENRLRRNELRTSIRICRRGEDRTRCRRGRIARSHRCSSRGGGARNDRDCKMEPLRLFRSRVRSLRMEDYSTVRRLRWRRLRRSQQRSRLDSKLSAQRSPFPKLQSRLPLPLLAQIDPLASPRSARVDCCRLARRTAIFCNKRLPANEREVMRSRSTDSRRRRVD